MKSTGARRPARPTLGAARPWITAGCATAQWKARFARRYPPPLEPPLANRAFSSFCGGLNPGRLTHPAKRNIIRSIRGSTRPMADIKSEPRPASNRNRWPASYWNARPASSESAAEVAPMSGIYAPASARVGALAPTPLYAPAGSPISTASEVALVSGIYARRPRRGRARAQDAVRAGRIANPHRFGGRPGERNIRARVRRCGRARAAVSARPDRSSARSRPPGYKCRPGL